MNRLQYEQYEKDVAAFMKSEGLNCLNNTPPENLVYSGSGVDDEVSEPYFSHLPCDCCGSTLGGDREDCSGFNPETREVQDGYSVCRDCVYYAAYGELDDDTMMGLDA